MTRFYGKVGFVSESVETEPGIFEPSATERRYRGTELQNTRYFNNNEEVNGVVSFQTRISIVADTYALKNFKNIRYIEWAGSFFTVDSVQAERPRLVLLIGEVYNGVTA